MKALLWRLVYAAIVVVMLALILPVFFSLIGFPLTGQLGELLKLVIACLAILYVLFGATPPSPF